MKIKLRTLITVGASLGVSAFATVAEAASKAPKAPKPPKAYNLTFAQADVDVSGSLTVWEFATTQGKGTPLAEVRKRFLLIDTAGAFEPVIDPVTGLPAVDPVTGLPPVDPVTGSPVVGAAIPDGLVTLEELNAYKALKVKPKSTLSRFELADFDGDDLLSPVELGYLVSPSAAPKSVVKRFDKLDINDDLFLTLAEFNKTKPAPL